MSLAIKSVCGRQSNAELKSVVRMPIFSPLSTFNFNNLAESV